MTKILGTGSSDILNGNDANDTLVGLGGNDTLNGGGGDDTLTGDLTDSDILAMVANKPAYDTWGIDYAGQSNTDALVAANAQMLIINPARILDSDTFTSETLWTGQEIQTIESSGKQLYGYIDVGKINSYLNFWNPAWTDNGLASGSDTSEAPVWLQGSDAPGSTARFVDFTDPDWQSLIEQRIATMINQGFDGAFLDDVGLYYSQIPANLTGNAKTAAIASNARAMRDFILKLRAMADQLRPPGADGHGFRLILNGDPFLIGDTTADNPVESQSASNAAFLHAIDGMLLENTISENSTVTQNAAVNNIASAGVPILSLDDPRGTPDLDETSLTAAQRLTYTTTALTQGFLPYTPDNLFTIPSATFLDILQGADTGPHNDVIDGGAGVNTATYSGPRDQYTITSQANVTTIIDNRPGSPDGTDTITNIQFLRFSDGTVELTSAGLMLFVTIGGALVGQVINTQQILAPFPMVTIADADAGQTETVTVTLSAAANGTLIDLGGGSYASSAGVYTDTGTAAAVTAAVKGLMFAPTVDQVPSGQTVTTIFTIADTDTAGGTASDSTTTVIATAIAVPPPAIVNNADGTSLRYVYNPTGTVSETIATYSDPGATGTHISDIVDNADGTSLLYAYDPNGDVTQTASEYSGTDPINGAPAGAQISDVVDNIDGTSLVYAYHPTSAVSLTAQQWSGTNSANGAPAGAEISDVVDNTDGTSVLYAYNPTGTVTQTASEYSGTNPANGAPAGAEISDAVDNADGTSVLYAYNPNSSVSLTASSYSGTISGTGAPAGTLTSETFDYTNGESAITTYRNGTSGTIDYGGPNGTGSVIAGITQTSMTSSKISSSTDAVPTSPQADGSSDGATITVTGFDQFVDPGTGNHTIQFAAGATGDTLLLHLGGSDQVLGFDPAAGAMLDLSSLLNEAGVNIGGDIARLSNYLSVTDTNNSAAISFDPSGQGGGDQVALLVNDGAMVAQLRALKMFSV